MFSRLIAILLVGFLAAENVSRVLVSVAFELNRGYIAVNLCENRDQPLLHCDGQCYLAKKLKEADEQQKQSEKESQKGPYHLAAFMTEKIVLTTPSGTAETIQATERSFVLPIRAHSVFHPPRS
jgi:hypothetical protein